MLSIVLSTFNIFSFGVKACSIPYSSFLLLNTLFLNGRIHCFLSCFLLTMRIFHFGVKACSIPYSSFLFLNILFLNGRIHCFIVIVNIIHLGRRRAHTHLSLYPSTPSNSPPTSLLDEVNHVLPRERGMQSSGQLFWAC